MKGFVITGLLAFVLAGPTKAQQFWVPGACWDLLGEHIGQSLYRYRYVGDTVVDGYSVQVVHFTIENLIPPSNPSPIFTSFYRMQGDAVLWRCGGLFLCPPSAAWDTLYWLGVPGDRWMGDDVDPNCYPLGVIEIQDTGHVVVQGITLRTWDIAYLDENGAPIPEDVLPNFGDSLGIIERIGGNLAPSPQPCDGAIVDYYWMTRTHYSDAEISLPEGSTCDIITGQARPTSEPPIAIAPNPGSSFQLTGLSGSAAQLRILDMQGRSVRDGIMINERTPVDLDELPPSTYIVELRFQDGARQLLRWAKE